ncbi:MAG: carbohydrate kinase family protein [Minisyncoccia bacterium]|jgi:ribokinase
MDPIDFFAIGDIATEPFIRLKDADVHCKINNEECEICMRWGDKIPYESFTICAAVGNSSNAAVAAARLGLHSALRAYLGKDRYGEDSLGVLKAEHVNTTYMVIDPTRPSNYHYVLWYGDNRIILVKHEEYDYTVPELASAPKWIYLSSLAANSLPYHQALIEWLKKYPESKLAFQPGTFQIKLGVEALRPIYERSDLFICNKEEAERILNKPAGSDMKELLCAMQALGPKIVVITDGKHGCYAVDEAGLLASPAQAGQTGKAIHVPHYPDPRPPFEITGAGDALASSTAAALALGKPLNEALCWGAANAAAVIQEIGAQKGLLTREQIEHAVAHPPAAWEIVSL